MSKNAGTIVAVILVVLVVGGVAYYMSTKPAMAPSTAPGTKTVK